MGKQAAAPRTALPMLRPIEWGFHERSDGVRKESRLRIEPRQWLAITFLQFRFVVPSVHMAGAAISENPNDGFSLGGPWRGFGCQRILCRRGAAVQHGLQCQPPHATTGALQKLAAIHSAGGNDGLRVRVHKQIR